MKFEKLECTVTNISKTHDINYVNLQLSGVSSNESRNFLIRKSDLDFFQTPQNIIIGYTEKGNESVLIFAINMQTMKGKHFTDMIEYYFRKEKTWNSIKQELEQLYFKATRKIFF